MNGRARRTLGFCCTVSHAEFMASYFREHGVDAVAVHSGQGSAPRAESLERLENGQLPVIFAVDLLNEGVDVPSVDIVLMLRPTESRVVFFQQLGRGLRRSEGKQRLDVLDLVGNHRSFLMKATLLAQLSGYHGRREREAVDLLRRGLTELPAGCSIVVDVEVIELMDRLLGAAKPVDRLVELVRQWVESHGRRPTALEAATALRRSIELPAGTSWFEFLDGLNLLESDERAALGVGRDLFRYIERGNYTKSFKLVTLRYMLDRGELRSGMDLARLATFARWEIQRDARLDGDLQDVASAFRDPANPTDHEWQGYWRRNPIRALTAEKSRADRGTFFTLQDNRLVLDLDVPDDMGDVFDRMADEMVGYRLHRYLRTAAARSAGEKRAVVDDDGSPLDATFTLESRSGLGAAVVLHSAGGTRNKPDARNVDYGAGLHLILGRRAQLGATIEDALVDSTKTRDLSASDRRLSPGDNQTYPLAPAEIGDPSALRKSLLRTMSKVGRDSDATGGGNARKTLRLVISGVAMPAANLAEALATGRTLATRPSESSVAGQTATRG